MIRVCLVSSRFFPRLVGSGTAAYMVALNLSLRGHHVVVITDESLRESHQDRQFPFEVQYVDGLEDYAIGDASMQTVAPQLLEHIIAVKPDILHVCNFMPMLLVSMFRTELKCSVVFSFYNTPGKNQRAIGYFASERLDHLLASLVIKYNSYDVLVANSQAYYNQALKLGATSDKLHLSYLGIDSEDFGPVSNTAEVVEEFLGDQIKGGDRYIILPSRVTPQKGIIEAVEALALVNKRTPIKLLLTGMAAPFDRAYARRVEDRIKQLGLTNQIMMPLKQIPRHYLPAFYQQAALTIIPSYYEGLGISAIEAQLLGVPLIAANTIGLDEVVTHNQNGLQFSPGNSDELAQCILKVLNDKSLANRLTVKAKKTVAKFDINQQMNDLENVYTKLLNKRGEHA